MKNKSVEFFNLSFLDLLSGALASVIFLFIIVPKGEPIAINQPVVVTYDTLQKKFYGIMPDSLSEMQEGDTLFALVGKLEANPEDVRSFARMETPAMPKPKPPVQKPPKKAEPVKAEPEKTIKEKEPEEKPTPKSTVTQSKFAGSKPDVPCVLSIEIKWGDKQDNVDLFVCKGKACVYGGKRHLDFIGQWDSGKARTSWFGAKTRTNQEAVRQFDKLLPGTYDIKAQYKGSEDPKSEIPLRLQVYTKNEVGEERGEEHFFKLNMNATERTLIATLTVGPNGELDFQTFK